jgi:hypothetical protein
VTFEVFTTVEKSMFFVLGFEALYTRKQRPIFRRSLRPESSDLKMETASLSEALVSIYEFTRR